MSAIAGAVRAAPALSWDSGAKGWLAWLASLARCGRSGGTSAGRLDLRQVDEGPLVVMAPSVIDAN